MGYGRGQLIERLAKGVGLETGTDALVEDGGDDGGEDGEEEELEGEDEEPEPEEEVVATLLDHVEHGGDEGRPEQRREDDGLELVCGA